MSYLKNNLIQTLCAGLLLVLFSAQPLPAQTIDKIVAIVNDEIITQSDVNRVLAAVEAEFRSLYSDPEEFAQKLKETKENIINQMVEEKLILCEAKKLGIEIEEEKIDARIEKIKKNFPGEEEFEKSLEAHELTLKDLRGRFRDQEIMKKAVDYFVRSEATVNPIEIKEFYQSHQQELVHPEKALVKSILIKVDASSNERQALEKARTILERLKAGESFTDLAGVYSQGTSASEGGDLGLIEKGQLIKEIDKAIFSLHPGEFSGAIRTPQGYRIFKVEEKTPAYPLTFAQAQDLIRDILYSEKFSQTFKKWIDQLKQNAYISIK